MWGAAQGHSGGGAAPQLRLIFTYSRVFALSFFPQL
jgi:hypothetical protein